MGHNNGLRYIVVFFWLDLLVKQAKITVGHVTGDLQMILKMLRSTKRTTDYTYPLSPRRK